MLFRHSQTINKINKANSLISKYSSKAINECKGLNDKYKKVSRINRIENRLKDIKIEVEKKKVNKKKIY